MAAANNLAYDISVYEPTPKKQTQRKIEARTINNVKTVSVVKSLLTAIAALFLLCAILNGKVETSKLYNDAAQLEEQYQILASENARLQTEIEGKTSYGNIEEYAQNNLGLKKLDNSQKEYLEVSNNSITKVVENKDKNVLIEIRDWFYGILEYIGV